MKPSVWIVALGMLLAATASASAAEQFVILKVDGMKNCASCPYIVKQALTRIAGVTEVMVSPEEETALVTYDDQQCTAAQLVDATAKTGFPSTVLQ